MRIPACAAESSAGPIHDWLAGELVCPWWVLSAALAVLLAMVTVLCLRLRRAVTRLSDANAALREARQAHATLRDSEVALHAGLAGVGHALIVVGVDGAVRYATPNVATTLGMNVDELRGRRVGEVFGAEIEARLHGQSPFTNQKVAVEHRGVLRMVRLDARVAPTLGPGWLLACRDVSEEVERERQAQAQRRAADDALHLASLGALVSSLAHEISNPNHAITLNVQVLKSAWQGVIPLLDELQRQRGEFKIANFPYTDMREEVLRMVDAIYQGADRIRALVTGLRDCARDYGRRQMVTLDPVAMLEQVTASTLVYKPELRGHLRLTMAAGLPKVRGNTNLLAHALLDLMLVAADGDGARGGDLDVSVRSAPGPRLLVEISGQGPPQEAKELARLAQAFQAGGEDVGLRNWRLALAGWIVHQHQGELQTEQSGEHRTVWRICLPGVERA